jgi:hypothetical protein
MGLRHRHHRACKRVAQVVVHIQECCEANSGHNGAVLSEENHIHDQCRKGVKMRVERAPTDVRKWGHDNDTAVRVRELHKLQ